MLVLRRGGASMVLATLFAAGTALAQTTQEKPAQGMPSNSNAVSATADCDQPNKPLSPEKIAGEWMSPKTGATLDLVQTDPKSTAKFTAKGQFSWDGTFGGGKLTLTRTPKAQEMSGAAPPWARQKVEGQIKWTMELEPKLKCGTSVLEGKWYPGAFSYEEDYDDSDQVVNQTASVTDPKGTPIDVLYEMRNPSQVFYYVQTATGLQNVEEFYLGVSMILEFQFDKPYQKKDFSADLSVGDQKLTLTAARFDNQGYIFRTNAFMPVTATLDKNDTFNPAPPPRPTNTGGRQ